MQSEKERWSQALLQYEEQEKTLLGDVLLTSAFVSYVGYFPRQYRVELFNNMWIPFLQSQKVMSEIYIYIYINLIFVYYKNIPKKDGIYIMIITSTHSVKFEKHILKCA